MKKASAGTPYAFIGLQISDIDDTHIAPAREELGEVTLESAKVKEDKDNLARPPSTSIKPAKCWPT